MAITRRPIPPPGLIEAVAQGTVDVAVVWGPIAGYFVQSQPARLAVVPVQPPMDSPALPFVFDISLGMRRGEQAFRAELEEVLQRQRPEINRILDAYGMPRVDATAQHSAAQ